MKASQRLFFFTLPVFYVFMSDDVEWLLTYHSILVFKRPQGLKTHLAFQAIQHAITLFTTPRPLQWNAISRWYHCKSLTASVSRWIRKKVCVSLSQQQRQPASWQHKESPSYRSTGLATDSAFLNLTSLLDTHQLLADRFFANCSPS